MAVVHHNCGKPEQAMVLLGQAWASPTLTRGLGAVSVLLYIYLYVTVHHSINVWKFLINEFKKSL